MLSSGTVGAAMEAAVAGRRAIAISFPFFNGWGNWSEQEIDTAVNAAGAVTEQLWQSWGEDVDMYNVNVPIQVLKHPVQHASMLERALLREVVAVPFHNAQVSI